MASITSVLSQKGIDPQIIISEQNLESHLEGLMGPLPVTHLFSRPPVDEFGNLVYNTGKIRNAAVSKVTTDYIYLNDADIIFSSENYLANLLADIKEEEALIWPPSRGLIKEDVESFLSLIDRKGFENAMREINLPNEYVASLSTEVAPLKVVKHKNGRIYVTEMSTFERYLSDESMRGLEPIFWRDVVHIGGIFTETRIVRAVGCYTDSYLTWGYEDVDLQWKLSQKCRVRTISPIKKFEVLHLDHDKNYFSEEQNDKNRTVFEKRQQEGIEKAIANDLEGLRCGMDWID
ncbi:MAG: hypothetical protein AABW46_00550 [Nanoarchaeota archaeon]